MAEAAAAATAASAASRPAPEVRSRPPRGAAAQAAAAASLELDAAQIISTFPSLRSSAFAGLARVRSAWGGGQSQDAEGRAISPENDAGSRDLQI